MVLVVFEIANRVFFIVFVNAHLDILSLHIPDEPKFGLPDFLTMTLIMYVIA